MDVIGWFIANTHKLLGHDKTAYLIGMPSGDKQYCVLCRFESGNATQQDVIDAIGVSK